MNSCEQTILQLLSRALFSADFAIDENIDWKKLYREAMLQTVIPLTYNAFTEDELSKMPSEVKERWRQLFFQNVTTNEQLLYAQNSVVNLLNEKNIACVVLKGKGSASHYPDPSLRVLGDIDLLVEPNKIEEVRQLLKDDGYEERAEGDLHIGFHKHNVTIELHRKPLSLSFNENEQIENEIKDFFSDIFAKRLYVDGIPVPSYEHQAIILLMHKLEHFLNGELGLRQLCDWAVFTQKSLTAELWQNLSPKLETFGIKTFTLVITKVCIDYLGLPKDCAEWAVDCDQTLAKDVIEHILESGNFGQKSGNNYGQRLFVDAHSKNRISSFFKVLGSTCKTHWPPCAKHPILLPIAPFVVYCKYLKMRSQGKRKKLKVGSLYKKAGTRQKLYKELKPFIIDDKN